MVDGEITVTKEDLEELLGRSVLLYRLSHKEPYTGTICSDNLGLPAVVFGDKAISLRNLDILDFGCEEVVYLSEKGI